MFKLGLDRSVLKKYREAGKIATKVRRQIPSFVEEEMPIIEVCERVEELIRKLGGQPAFPCNVSIDEVAAHYTSPPKDDKIIPRNSIVKVDLGVHVDGYIVDTAVTVCFREELNDMVLVAKEALSRGIKIIHADLSASDFGRHIKEYVESQGFKVIANLTGHQIARYMLHAGKSLPNVPHISTSRIKEGEIYAIEPFVTTYKGKGKVVNGPPGNIYRLVKLKSPSNPAAKKVLNYVKSHFRTLPFAERWLRRVLSEKIVDEGLPKLLSSKILMVYPTFIEAAGKPVAQAEHTVVVTKKGCEVLT